MPLWRLDFVVAFAAGLALGKGTSAEFRRWVRMKIRRAVRGLPLGGELWEIGPRERVRKDWWAERSWSGGAVRSSKKSAGE